MKPQNMRSPSAATWYALLLFFAGVALSGTGAYFQHRQIDKNAKTAFEHLSERTELEVSARLDKVVRGLHGVRGPYLAKDQKIRREEFRRLVLSRDMDTEFPGVRGFGFIERVERSALAAFVAGEQADGAAGFSIQQLADKNKLDLFIVKYIEPAARNKGAQGLDVGSEALRRAGLQQAINTGAATVTGTITLVQDDQKLPALLLYVPVYRYGAPIDIPKERRAALVGVLYAPIVISEVLQGMPDVQSGMLDFEIVDSPINSSAGTLMFDAGKDLQQVAAGTKHLAGRRYALRKPLQLPGRSVTLNMQSTPAFDASFNLGFPWLLFGAGTLISALLATMLRQQAGGRLRAERLAHDMTLDLQMALRDNQALLSTLNVHSIVSVADRGGRITEVNDAFCQISGYGRGELIGKNHRVLSSAVQPSAFWEEMWKTISSGSPWRGQVCNLRKDGSLYWLDTLIAPFIGSEGQIEKYISIRTDITELMQATEAAQAASLSKSQFLANMSHEIRTPMNAILGMLTLLRKTELTTRQEDYAAKSEGAARALLSLLNEVLDFSKIEAGKMELDPHPFAVDQMLRDLSVILSTNVGDKPIEVLFDIDPLLPRHLVADAMRLQQVLLNLGSNAIKFTAQGEVVLSIQVLLCTDDVVTLQFSMRDSGIGIAPENQARIFSGFTQAESSTTRRFGGTGLGVVISQRFVALMGGELELQSELGRGSRFFFTVTLPIAAASDEQERQRERAEGASWRVLVIDDNPVAREVMVHMGQSLGWQVDLAESGEQALDLQQQRADQSIHYEAIFVDWSMPGMDGWQTSKKLRELQAHSTSSNIQPTMLVMLTAHGREMLSQRSAAEQALLDGFLVKPVTASMLLKAVLDARAEQLQPQTSRRVAPHAQRRLEGMRLLLVEDNLNNQQVARELLLDEGAVVQIANHGREAVEALAATGAAFDVVLMDLQMPVMDGFVAARLIRQDLRLSTLPIVAMTANAMAVDREACLAAGMNDHIGKPFDLNDLVRVLRKQAQWVGALTSAADKSPVLSTHLVQAATAAGVDLAAALHRLGGKQDVYRRTLMSFVRDLQAMPDQLQAATPNDAKRLLHTLKGLAATLGVTLLASETAGAEKSMAPKPTREQALSAGAHACQFIEAALPGLLALLEVLQQDHAVTAGRDQAGSSAPPLDRPALLKALQSMAQLLQACDMESVHAMAQLQQQFGAASGEELEAMEAAIADLAFERALPLCHALQEHYAL